MRKKTQSCGLVVSACNPDMLSCGACVGNAAANRTFVPILEALAHVSGDHAGNAGSNKACDVSQSSILQLLHVRLYFTFGQMRQTLFPKNHEQLAQTCDKSVEPWCLCGR